MIWAIGICDDVRRKVFEDSVVLVPLAIPKHEPFSCLGWRWHNAGDSALTWEPSDLHPVLASGTDLGPIVSVCCAVVSPSVK